MIGSYIIYMTAVNLLFIALLLNIISGCVCQHIRHTKCVSERLTNENVSLSAYFIIVMLDPGMS